MYTESVGAGLLANAFIQPPSTYQTHRVRQQAGSYRGTAFTQYDLHQSRVLRRLDFLCRKIKSTATATATATVDFDLDTGSEGAGLLANAFIQPPSAYQTHRVRQQAGSYRGLHSFSKASVRNGSSREAFDLL
ncbi:hypothetical protein [Pseudomonas sp. ME-P-057]|uniref:hypothetical protein n=1 Tax=Pseudomonas sp. ME-P-057 TaxID=3040321 RepID=UPI0025522C5D|nr:hypothetical protein [Pseudomonas sp. ME-P-057]